MHCAAAGLDAARRLRPRHADEDARLAQTRADMLAWIARDGLSAAKRMAHRATGLERARLGAKYAPASWTPPMLIQAALAFPPLHDPLAIVDAS